ncbi:hypothetical protein LIER_15421 [Lithospermum erythrorhizon]|uniref:Retrotransposon gag protein n=1 Tax=Lithospermum erythrorhizon TaxID=34254 RepID=A0AAV3Q7E5_LITER
MELSNAANKGYVPSAPAASCSKAKYEPRKSKEASKLEKKEAHVVPSKTAKFSFRTKKVGGGLDLGKKERLTLKQMQEKHYPFLEYDVPSMFDELLKAKLIELSESERPEEANRSTEPNFCKYHRILGHPIEKCFIFKERVMDLARKGAITLEEDKVSSNHITLTIVQCTEVKVPADFWESKLILGKVWADYSDDEDHEACHVCVEDDEDSTTAEVLRMTLPALSSLQTFAITFTDGDLPQEDGTHNKPLYVSDYVNESRLRKMLVDEGSTINILPLQTLKLLGIFTKDLQ